MIARMPRAASPSTACTSDMARPGSSCRRAANDPASTATRTPASAAISGASALKAAQARDAASARITGPGIGAQAARSARTPPTPSAAAAASIAGWIAIAISSPHTMTDAGAAGSPNRHASASASAAPPATPPAAIMASPRAAQP